MARTLDAKCRLCRRVGTKLFLKGERCFTPKCAIVKRNYPPGVSGAKKAKPRLTTYGLQLREKQKAKIFYRMSEKQFRNTFEKSSSKVGNTGELMIQMLETRLDNIVYRLGWARSRSEARQFVSHGMVHVDEKRVTIPSYRVSVGQRVTLKPGVEKYTLFNERKPLLEKFTIPSWLSSEKGAYQAKTVALPTLEEAAPVFDVKSIVEFYSR